MIWKTRHLQNRNVWIFPRVMPMGCLHLPSSSVNVLANGQRGYLSSTFLTKNVSNESHTHTKNTIFVISLLTMISGPFYIQTLYNATIQYLSIVLYSNKNPNIVQISRLTIVVLGTRQMKIHKSKILSPINSTILKKLSFVCSLYILYQYFEIEFNTKDKFRIPTI